MGDIMETLERSEKMLCKSIEEINQNGELNATYLDYLGKAIDALKDIHMIKEKSEGSYERYMADGYSRGRRRDSMGRYMDDGYRGYNRDGYNAEYGYRNYGHSGEEEKDFIRQKMQSASNEQEREKYRRILEMM